MAKKLHQPVEDSIDKSTKQIWVEPHRLPDLVLQNPRQWPPWIINHDPSSSPP
ncbi:hypothetical protein E4U52_007786 [Claviceps spartinae]|nr:hypothetical protein E4U52_007786 [Claviceps spartinae]